MAAGSSKYHSTKYQDRVFRSSKIAPHDRRLAPPPQMRICSVLSTRFLVSRRFASQISPKGNVSFARDQNYKPWFSAGKMGLDRT